MKTWILYLATFLMAFSTTLIFGDSATALEIFRTLSTMALQVGSFVFIPLLFIGCASGISSLRKDDLTRKVHVKGLAWIILTALLIPFIAAAVFYFYPAQFPVSSTAGASSNQAYVLSLAKKYSTSTFTNNPFLTMALSSVYLLPIMIIAWLFGYALKPNVDVIKPAYAVFNSLSEVMFRISHIYTTFGYILTYILATTSMLALYNEKTIFVSPIFLVTILSIVALIALVVLPLIYLALTRQNPYKILYRCLAALITGFSAGNAFVTSPMIETLTRHNVGVQKRISATVTPLFALLSRAGSATMATLSLSAIIYAATGELPTFSLLATIALLSTLVSFVASTAVTFEIPFIMFAIMKMGNITLFGAEMTLYGLLPLFMGLGYLLDVEITLLGVSLVGVKTQTNVPTLYNDIV